MKNARLYGRGPQVLLYLILSVLVNLVFSERSVAQAPVANFSANVSSGCSPLIVQFTDQSTGGVTTWFWDLGNGSTSSVQNPTSTYITPGTYTVKLTASNASGSSTKTTTITVTPGPTAKFTSTDTAGCTPHTVTFTDQSTTSAGSITGWEWNFGDGGTSTQQNPTHTYTMSGTFNVYLKITTSTGCSQTIFKQQYIRAGAGAKADFIANVPNYCQVPVNVNFSNTSQTEPGTTYLWNFGDGGTSTSPNPSHTYTAFGNYNVVLQVRSPDGCTSTKQQTISLGGRNVNFTGPTTVCAGSVASFVMTSSPKPLSQTWNMGDGATYSDTAVNHTYSAAGTYTVTLTNEFSGGCVSTKTQSVTVMAGPAVTFTADTTKACKPPFTVNFQSSGATGGFNWDFGDGSTSTQQNPTHTYQTSGEFTVKLTASNATGCVSTIEKPAFIRIQLPSLTITNVPVNNGCTPYSFSPVANINSAEGVASYFWDFGNGVTSTKEEPTYTYTTPGSYTIRLRIQTNGGCADSVVYANAVNISAGTNLDFSASPINACVDQAVQFTPSTTATGATYQWYFGDGDSSDLPSPAHSYKTSGKFSVTLKITYGSCVSKLTKDEYINVQPPEAKFLAVRDCGNKRLINFTNQSVGTGTITWNFGDGGSSSDANPSHLYAADGTYTVSLTVNSGTCSHTLTQQIEVSSASIDFYFSKTTVCKNEAFLARALVPNTIQASQFQWTIVGYGGAASQVDSLVMAAAIAGVYDVSLKVISVTGCEDVVTKAAYLTVFGPTADFISDKPGGCEATSINFADSSASDGTHPITQWIWNFGDSSAPASGPNVSHTYAGSGRYPVSLTVTDSYGCTDQRVKANFVSITNGKAMFMTMDTMSCSGSDVIFIDTSVGLISSWEWSFGDGSVITGVQNPVHAYTDTGYYTVKLKIIETSGCMDSVTKTNYITIKNPDAKFGLSDTFSTCPPLTVSFYDSSYYVRKWQWDFGDGGGSPVASPINLYNIPNTYNVKLTVTSPGGCKDSAFAKIRILGPYGQFNYTPISGCTPLLVNYSVTSTEAVKFLWDYSDGVVDSGTAASSSHTYLSGGKFVPKVILTDAAGCRVPVVGKDSIYIEKTNLDFTGDKLAFCDSGTVAFTNQSVMVNAASVSYTWNFNGNTATTQDASYSFGTAGSYDVTLTSVTPMGCRDTLTKTAYVRVHQSPVATIGGADSLCKPAAFTFSAQLQPDTSGIRSWQWTFGNGNTDTTQAPAEQVFPNEGSYTNTLFIQDNEGCTTSVSKTVVVHPLPLLQLSQGIMICRGDTTRLSATGAATYNWLVPNNDLSCTDCPNPMASPSYDMLYRVEGFSEFGCKSTDSVTVKVYQPYKISVEPSLGYVCEGKKLQLKAFGAPLYSWTPSLGLSAANVSNPFASPDTTTVYKVTGYDSLGCFRDSAEVTVRVLGSPTVNAGSDVVVSAGSTASLSATGSADVISYTWSPYTGLSCIDCPNTIVTAGDNIAYTVTVTNAAGCSAQDQVKVLVTCDNSNLFVPNTFTPNGDGMNDVFYIRGKGLFAVKSMKIFNRWGELVFEKKDVDPNSAADGWTGMFKGTLAPADTYVYQLEVLCSNSQVLRYNGTISLIR